ncbi:MAG: hypothetical protein WBM06_17100 [Pseudolabrys sp.]
MPAFIFRCPHTGLNVQGHVEDDDKGGHAFEAITCMACGEVHLVDAITGKLLGEGLNIERDSKSNALKWEWSYQWNTSWMGSL